MKVGSKPKSLQCLFEKPAKGTSLINDLENEIECPRCHDVMTLCSDFDFLYYKCEQCDLPLYTSPNSDY